MMVICHEMCTIYPTPSYIFARPLQVNWMKGDATNMKTVEEALKDSDAAVHAIGELHCTIVAC